MLRPAFGLLSPGGASGRLNVMIFHRVLARPDPLFPHEMHVRRFDQTCGWLRRWFHVLPLVDAVRRLQSATLPPRALAITFDDGYRDNHEVALPILRRHGLTASFFIATGYIGGGRMFNDTLIEAVRSASADDVTLGDLLPECTGPIALVTVADRQAAIARLIRATKYLPAAKRQATVDAVAARCASHLPANLMMDRDQVRDLHRQGMEVGAHTVTHPILANLDPDTVRREVVQSRDALQEWIDAPVRSFAYPNGRPGEDYSPANVDVVRSLDFDAAVSTAWGVATSRTDPMQVPRFTPWDETRLRFGLRLLRQLMHSRDRSLAS